MMPNAVQILLCVLILAMVGYIAMECAHESFGAWYNPCAGPCHRKGERDCCACAKCAWFIDHNYNGRCIRRGTWPDSCLMRPSYYHGHHQAHHHGHHSRHQSYHSPRAHPWYSPYRWYYSSQRPVVHRGPGWVKDSWGRWIRASPSHRRHTRRSGRRRVGRRFHHL